MLCFLKAIAGRPAEILERVSKEVEARKTKVYAELLRDDRAALRLLVGHGFPPLQNISIIEEVGAATELPDPRDRTAYHWALAFHQMTMKWKRHSGTNCRRCRLLPKSQAQFPKFFFSPDGTPVGPPNPTLDIAVNLESHVKFPWHQLMARVRPEVGGQVGGNDSSPSASEGGSDDEDCGDDEGMPPVRRKSPEPKKKKQKRQSLTTATTTTAMKAAKTATPAQTTAARPTTWGTPSETHCLLCRQALCDAVVLCPGCAPVHALCRRCAQALIDAEAATHPQRPESVTLRCGICGSAVAVPLGLGASALASKVTGQPQQGEALARAKQNIQKQLPALVEAGKEAGRAEQRAAERILEIKRRQALLEEAVDHAFEELEAAAVSALRARREELARELRRAGTGACDALRECTDRAAARREMAGAVVARARALGASSDPGTALRLSRAISAEAAMLGGALAEDARWFSDPDRARTLTPSIAFTAPDVAPVVSQISQAVNSFGSIIIGNGNPSTSQQLAVD